GYRVERDGWRDARGTSAAAVTAGTGAERPGGGGTAQRQAESAGVELDDEATDVAGNEPVREVALHLGAAAAAGAVSAPGRSLRSQAAAGGAGAGVPARQLRA